MTRIESLEFQNKKILDLSDIKNIQKLSTIEQKNIAILVVARNELSRLKNEDKDNFSNLIFEYLERNVPEFKELEQLFLQYFNEKNQIIKNKIFKQIKPIEPLAVYLSEIAVVFNKISKISEIAIKGFVYSLILEWFEVEKMQSTYLSEISRIGFQPEINKLIERTKSNKELRVKLNEIFDNAIEITEFLRDFKYKNIIPLRCIKGKKKK